MEQLEKAYRYCEEVIKHHSKTFYKAFSVLPQEKRKAVWAVYAFCRQVDDIVDEGTDAIGELAQFREQFRRFVAGEELEGEMWLALRDVFRTYDMDVVAFEQMIQGQEMDLTKARYETIDEMLHYSYYVASTVGLMLLPILAPQTKERLRDSAIALGQAMQVTNILRDIGEDLWRGRVYFPREVMVRHGFDETLLVKGERSEAFIAAWEELAQLAERLYEEALSAMHYYPLMSRLPVKGAAHLYRAILGAVRKHDYDVFTAKQFVDDEEKQRIIANIS